MIYKNIDGENRVVATAVTDHAQLTGREVYGAHPIEAIRGLSAMLRKIRDNLTKDDAHIEAIITDIDALQHALDEVGQSLSDETQRAKEAEAVLTKTAEHLEQDKLDNIKTASDFDRAYVVDKTGSSSSISISENPTNGTLVQRTDDGRAQVGYPKEDDDAINMAYSNKVKGDLQAEMTAGDEAVKTLLDTEAESLLNILAGEGYAYAEPVTNENTDAQVEEE